MHEICLCKHSSVYARRVEQILEIAQGPFERDSGAFLACSPIETYYCQIQKSKLPGSRTYCARGQEVGSALLDAGAPRSRAFMNSDICDYTRDTTQTGYYYQLPPNIFLKSSCPFAGPLGTCACAGTDGPSDFAWAGTATTFLALPNPARGRDAPALRGTNMAFPFELLAFGPWVSRISSEIARVLPWRMIGSERSKSFPTACIQK